MPCSSRYEPLAKGELARVRHGLGKVGFALDRQRGSHLTLIRLEQFAALIVPDHRELDAGTLRAILREAGVLVEEFRASL
jgi:predicted RNA binding protein YcfA (HicA-like mRNA interferase family)